MDYLLLVNVVERLEVNTLVCYVKETLYLNEWQNSFDSKFSREKTFLREILNFAKIERNLRRSILPTAGRIITWVQLVCQVRKQVFDLHFIAKSILGLERLNQQCQSLVKLVKLVELNINVKSVISLSIRIRRSWHLVLLIGLWTALRWNFNQTGNTQTERVVFLLWA